MRSVEDVRDWIKGQLNQFQCALHSPTENKRALEFAIGTLASLDEFILAPAPCKHPFTEVIALVGNIANATVISHPARFCPDCGKELEATCP